MKRLRVDLSSFLNNVKVIVGISKETESVKDVLKVIVEKCDLDSCFEYELFIGNFMVKNEESALILRDDELVEIRKKIQSEHNEVSKGPFRKENVKPKSEQCLKFSKSNGISTPKDTDEESSSSSSEEENEGNTATKMASTPVVDKQDDVLKPIAFRKMDARMETTVDPKPITKKAGMASKNVVCKDASSSSGTSSSEEKMISSKSIGAGDNKRVQISTKNKKKHKWKRKSCTISTPKNEESSSSSSDEENEVATKMASTSVVDKDTSSSSSSEEDDNNKTKQEVKSLLNPKPITKKDGESSKNDPLSVVCRDASSSSATSSSEEEKMISSKSIGACESKTVEIPIKNKKKRKRKRKRKPKNKNKIRKISEEKLEKEAQSDSEQEEKIKEQTKSANIPLVSIIDPVLTAKNLPSKTVRKFGPRSAEISCEQALLGMDFNSKMVKRIPPKATTPKSLKNTFAVDQENFNFERFQMTLEPTAGTEAKMLLETQEEPTSTIKTSLQDTLSSPRNNHHTDSPSPLSSKGLFDKLLNLKDSNPVIASRRKFV